MRNKQYWIDRANRRMDSYTLSAIEQSKVINKAYNRTKTYVEAEIAKILKHTGGEDTLAYEYRMKRLNALLKTTEEKMKELYGINVSDTTAFLKSIIPEAYYHTIFDIAQGVGEQPVFAAVNDKLINAIVKEPWSGENYSKRIWKNTNKLADDVRGILTEAAMSGESIYKTSRKLSDAFDTSAYNSQRLIRTETTYACNQAEMASYEALDIDKYRFVATLDTRTSPICQKLDGEVFDTKDAQAGKNLPAMHPNCRSTTIPYFEEGMPEERIARDKDGKRIKVPADMKYDDWYKQYINPEGPPKPGKGNTPPTTQKPPEKQSEKPQTKPEQPKPVDVEILPPEQKKPEYVDTPIPEKPVEVPKPETRPAEEPELTIFEEMEQNRELIDAALHLVEEERRPLDYEVGTIIDRQGNVVDTIQGQEHSVAVDDGVLKDMIFTHNHPSGGCFSDGDIESMISDELLELRASTPQGTYYSLVRTAKADKYSTFAYDYKKANSIVTATKQVQEDLKKGIITKQEIKDKGFNIYIEYMSKSAEKFLQENAEKYGYIYTKGVI